MSARPTRRRSVIRRRLGDAVFNLVVAPLVAWAVRAIAWTRRVEFVGFEHFERLSTTERPVIWAFWHENLIGVTTACYLRLRDGRGVAVMVSRSRDGSRLARVIGRLGMTAVRASSSRGAVRGFLQMHRWLTRPGGRAAMALDGPRGPRHQAKPGIAMLARKSGAWVVPIEFTHTRRIVFNSWDRTRLPLPFGHTRVVFGEPIDAAEWGDDDTANAAQIQRALLVLRDASSSCATSHR